MKKQRIKITSREAEVMLQIFLRHCGNSKYIYNATTEEVRRTIHILRDMIEKEEENLKTE